MSCTLCAPYDIADVVPSARCAAGNPQVHSLRCGMVGTVDSTLSSVNALRVAHLLMHSFCMVCCRQPPGALLGQVGRRRPTLRQLCCACNWLRRDARLRGAAQQRFDRLLGRNCCVRGEVRGAECTGRAL
jgi:hypothetical protein